MLIGCPKLAHLLFIITYSILFNFSWKNPRWRPFFKMTAAHMTFPVKKNIFTKSMVLSQTRAIQCSTYLWKHYYVNYYVLSCTNPRWPNIKKTANQGEYIHRNMFLWFDHRSINLITIIPKDLFKDSVSYEN